MSSLKRDRLRNGNFSTHLRVEYTRSVARHTLTRPGKRLALLYNNGITHENGRESPNEGSR